MPVVNAGPDQFLLVGSKGTLENRGSAVHAVLRPRSIFVLVPSSKQEAAFEFTQETRDGISLRSRGSSSSITDPVAAARQFDFRSAAGIAQISALLTHVCLGELRHAVSHMTMVECIEQRKTTLSEVVRCRPAGDDPRRGRRQRRLGDHRRGRPAAQVFIVDTLLRQQLEAEVRNEIKLKSDQADLRAREETHLAEMVSDGRVEERKLAADRESMRRQEELELAQLARQRRMGAEKVADRAPGPVVELEGLHAQLEADEDRINAEAPVRLLKIATERRILAEELELRRLESRVRSLDVELELADAAGQAGPPARDSAARAGAQRW